MSILEQFAADYLPANEFWRQAYDALGALEKDDIRQRRGEAKPLVEEVFPIGLLAVQLAEPGREVACRHIGGNEPVDGTLRFQGREVDLGFLLREYNVEVTTAESEKDYLKREALTKYGGVFGGEDIRRLPRQQKGERGEIESNAVAMSSEEWVALYLTWIRERLKAKAAKTYPPPTILIVNLIADTTLEWDDWVAIVSQARPYVDRSAFVNTYLMHAGSKGVVAL